MGDHPPTAVRAGVGHREPHQRRPDAAGAASARTASRSPFHSPLAGSSGYRRTAPTGWLPERQHPDDVVARVVLVDVGLGEDRLLLDEHRVPDPVVHRALSGGARLDADHLASPGRAAQVDATGAARHGSGFTDRACDAGICSTAGGC